MKFSSRQNFTKILKMVCVPENLLSLLEWMMLVISSSINITKPRLRREKTENHCHSFALSDWKCYIDDSHFSLGYFKNSKETIPKGKDQEKKKDKKIALISHFLF